MSADGSTVNIIGQVNGETTLSFYGCEIVQNYNKRGVVTIDGGLYVRNRGDNFAMVDLRVLAENTVIKNATFYGGPIFAFCGRTGSASACNVTIDNCHFIEENPSVIAGKDGNVCCVSMNNCTFEYKKGHTHPYFEGKMDLQPNIEHIFDSPCKVGDTLYVSDSKNITLNGEKLA